MNESELKSFLTANPAAAYFVPYCYLSKSADALTIIMARDADYTKRLTDEITVSVSLATDKVIGCRLERIGSVLSDLRNYVTIKDDSIPIQLILFAFSGGVNGETRQALIALARLAAEHEMVLSV